MSVEVPSPSRARKTVARIRSVISRGVIGQETLLDGLLAGLLANGHVLVEGVPGLAKTRAVHLLARACAADFKRLQFTPDLLPADIIGTQIYNQQSGDFETRIGPVFTHFVLADEINRAAPKVQSALLEAMQERQVTIGAETHLLPRPFAVFATQNPIEQEGTYPLPEAQVDRFLLKLVVGYPQQEDEKQLVRLVMNETELPAMEPVADGNEILGLQEAVRRVHVEERILAYATDLVFATRFPDRYDLQFEGLIELGASPRASIALVQVARSRALMEGRDSVIPEDVKAVAPDVLRHRLLTTYHAEAEGITSDDLIRHVLAGTKVP
jgi:MoxR-like ATPase